jgi:hypothetical protein
MLATIDFNHKPCFRTVEIDYVVADGLLSVELALLKLFSPDFGSKQLFCLSHVLSKVSGTRL